MGTTLAALTFDAFKAKIEETETLTRPFQQASC